MFIWQVQPRILRTKTPFLTLVVFAAVAMLSPLSFAVTQGRDWPLGDAQKAGFDQSRLDALVQAVKEGEFPNTHALLIEHDGKLVLERYFAGTDERWGVPLGSRELKRDGLHDLRSVSKSVTAVILGIALKDRFQEKVDRPIASYFPRRKIREDRQEITLQHILTMTSGLAWNEMTVPYTDPKNDEIRLYEAKDPVLYVLHRPQVEAPGRTWYYSGGATQVLASVITALTGKSLQDFGRECLFEPLGIKRFEWLGPSGWKNANPAAMSGLRLRARDLAKIGSLHLHGGKWQGKSIVPAEWIKLSTARHVTTIGSWSQGGIWGYGYQWWVGELPAGFSVIAGVGNGNQRVFVLPEPKLVVTILAGEYNKFEGHSDRLLDRVLETFKSPR